MGFFSCTKNELCEENTDCTKEILEIYKMVPYTGQTNYCMSLDLYEFENRQYFIYNCCVCDLIPNPVYCDNTSYCMTNGAYDEFKCNLFFEKSRRIGIVGILE